MKNLLYVVLTVIASLALLSMVACSSEPTSSHNPPESTVGGWTAVEDGTITEELQAIFDEATDGLTGCKYEAVELIATQVVAGRNYKFLCNVTPIVSDATTTQKYAIIYVDLDGNCSLTEFQDIT